LSYRGISLSCTMNKVYCSILNDRLTNWSEDNSKLVDEQNSFWKQRVQLIICHHLLTS
jgi:hypothetical protein